MKKAVLFLVCLGMSIILPFYARAEIRSGSGDVSFYLGGFIGLDKTYSEPEVIPYGITDMACEPGNGVIVGISSAWNFTPYIGIEGGFAFSNADLAPIYYIDSLEIKGEDIGASMGGTEFIGYANLILHLLPKSKIVPFLTGGIGFMYLWGTAEVNGYEVEDWSENHFCATWGGGIKIFLSDQMYFRINVRNFNLKLDDTRDRLNWMEVSGGVGFVF